MVLLKSWLRSRKKLSSSIKRAFQAINRSLLASDPVMLRIHNCRLCTRFASSLSSPHPKRSFQYTDNTHYSLRPEVLHLFQIRSEAVESFKPPTYPLQICALRVSIVIDDFYSNSTCSYYSLTYLF